MVSNEEYFPRLTTDGVNIVLASQVALGFCDICASGCRAVLGVKPPNFSERREWFLNCELVPSTDISSSLGEYEKSPIKLVTFFNSSGSAVASFITVLGSAQKEHEMLLAAALLDFIEQHSGPETEVVVVAALRLAEAVSSVDSLHSSTSPLEDQVYWVSIPTTQPAIPGFASLPPSTPLADGILAALMHLCRSRAQRACFLLSAGHRPRTLLQAAHPQHMQRILLLGKALGKVMNCGVSEASIQNSCVERLWFNQAQEACPIYI
eukprot:CAMPEP_0196591862 /NCGR_PEP_ID=MMETSP1081-20130531/71116_1 /TAXON_ID=36882 /ORGANISM="Pyramimonas amylifera, Strain CCMP720" /LENGTH=264 /DNA_ID=CAMNT_0041915373 /DNA_START=174 /DNA_END=968 /DNA_ORIENTATION=+